MINNTGAAVDGRMVSKFEKRNVVCRCGQTNPTRRHLLWQCTSLSDTRKKFGIQQAPPAATAAPCQIH